MYETFRVEADDQTIGSHIINEMTIRKKARLDFLRANNQPAIGDYAIIAVVPAYLLNNLSGYYEVTTVDVIVEWRG